MAAEPSKKPVPLCEVCWLIDHTFWEPESMTSDGKIVMQLVKVDVPDKINTESVEICFECGSITVAGIYELREDLGLEGLQEDEESQIMRDYYAEYEDPTRFIFDINPQQNKNEGYEDYE